MRKDTSPVLGEALSSLRRLKRYRESRHMTQMWFLELHLDHWLCRRLCNRDRRYSLRTPLWISGCVIRFLVVEQGSAFVNNVGNT